MRQIKQNLKTLSILLGALLLTGLIGLILGMLKVNRNYEADRASVKLLVEEVISLKQQLEINRKKAEKYDFMEYKVAALSSRYPHFSHILDMVYFKSRQYGFNPALVLGVVQVESDFNPRAVSSRGAYGLMQVNLPVWKNEYAIDSQKIFNIDYNLELGLKILRQYYDETGGNLKRALHLYNNGYLYNNLAYLGKVNAASLAFRPVRFHLTQAAMF